MIFLLLFVFILYLMSSEKSDLLDGESDKLGSDSGSSGMYYFRAFSLNAE